MALRSGLAAQLGIIPEVTPGVPLAVTTFIPMLSDSMSAETERLESGGIIANRIVAASEQWAAGRQMVGGDTNFELYTKNLRTLLKACFGTETGSSPYTYTPAEMAGLSTTIQIGTPGVGGVVTPRTYSGCKAESWEMGLSVGELCTFSVTWAAMKEILYRTVADGATNTNTTVTSVTAAFTADDIGKPISGTNIPAATTITAVASATSVTISQAATGTGTGLTLVIGIALAAASYATNAGRPVTFTHGSVTIGGTAAPIKAATLSANNGLDTERFFLGSMYRSEPFENALREYTLSMDLEFTDLTQYRRYLNGTEHAVVLTMTVPGTTFSLAITTNVRFDGMTPQVGGREIIQQNISMKCLGSSTDASALTAVLTEAA